MKVYGLWYGGPDYSSPELSDLEEFGSMLEAKYAFENRENNGDWDLCYFRYVNKQPESNYCPAVRESEMQIWFADPTDSDDPYPDRIISFGPNGGVRVNRV